MIRVEIASKMCTHFFIYFAFFFWSIDQIFNFKPAFIDDVRLIPPCCNIVEIYLFISQIFIFSLTIDRCQAKIYVFLTFCTLATRC